MNGRATITFRASAVRRGVTLAEIIVAVAILVILGSIVVSTDLVVSSNDRERYDAAADTLRKLAWTIGGSDPTNAQTSFKWVIQKYPRKLSHLTKPILNTDTDICGTAYAVPSRWVNAFWPIELRTTGTILVSGFTAQDDLGKFGDASYLGYYNGSGVLQAAPPGLTQRTDGIISIRMTNVTQADAQGLDAAVDGTPVDGAAGTVRYSASDPTTVDYLIMVSGC